MANTLHKSIWLLILYIFIKFTTAIITQKWKQKYDYIIVGGGTAGCVLANRLSEYPNISVLVLEAGEEPKDPFIPIPSAWLSVLTNDEIDWGFQTESQPHTGSKQGIKWSQAKMLGGCSQHNVILASRGSPADYNRWYELGNKGWSYKDVLPYFKKSEHIADDKLANNGFHGINGPVEIRIDYKDPIMKKLLKSAIELGFVELLDINGPKLEGFGWAQINVNSKGQRSGVFEAYLKPVLARNNLDVVTHALVTKIDIKRSKKSKKAKGIFFKHDGNGHYVKAKKEVIVSAGAINSPKLLMLSGIGPKKHLKQMGIELVADLPVGNNLQDHPIVILKIPISESSMVPRTKYFTFGALFEYIFTGKGIWSSPESTVVSFHRSTSQSAKDLFPYMELFFFPPAMGVFQTELLESIRNGSGINFELVKDLQNHDKDPSFIEAAVVNLHARTRGTVTLNSKNPDDKPIIDFPYLDHKEDLQDVIEGIRRIQSLVGTSTLKAAGAQSMSCSNAACSNKLFDSDAYWECCVRCKVSTLHHHVGTCKMANDNTGVVDNKLRVKGIKRLRVIDSSIMPLVPSAHTHIPTIMVGEKGADLVKSSQNP